MSGETTSAGATPAATDATSVQSSSAQPTAGSTTAATTTPAKGDEDALGEPGKRALQVERDAVKAAKAERDALAKELEAIKLSTATDAEKAAAAAKSEGKAEVTERLHAVVRRSAVREALTNAGAMPSLVADLSRADEFTGLKVGGDDEIDPKELAKAVEAHKLRVPDAYRAPIAPVGTTGSADGGAAGGGQPRATSLEEAVNRHYNRQATT